LATESAFHYYAKSERAFDVNLNRVSLIIRHVDGFVDHVNRARRNASVVVDAHLGINVGALLVGVKARQRIRRYAIGKAARVAIVGHDVGHGGLS
jgi:hypothetical protein